MIEIFELLIVNIILLLCIMNIIEIINLNPMILKNINYLAHFKW